MTIILPKGRHQLFLSNCKEIKIIHRIHKSNTEKPGAGSDAAKHLVDI